MSGYGENESDVRSRSLRSPATNGADDSDERSSFALTVVVNTYARPDGLLQALRSVVAQAGPAVEVLVVDDGSPDDMTSIVSDVYGDLVRVVRQANAGLSAARNTGWREAAGQFVVFLDDDDVLLPGAVASFLSLSAAPDAGIVCGAVRCVEADGLVRTLLPQSLGPSMHDLAGSFLAGSWAMRRDVLSAVGGYDEQVLASHQHELFMRAVPFCVAKSLDVLSTSRAVAQIHRSAPGERLRNHPDRLYSTDVHLLKVHGARLLRTDPAVYAGFASSAGVAAMKLGLTAEGRRYLWKAVRADTANHRGWWRLAAALCPASIRRMVWRP